MAAPSNIAGPSHMAVAMPNDKNPTRHADWLMRQRMMLLDIECYAGQPAPDRVKHTRDQMEHMLPVLPMTHHLKKMKTPAEYLLNDPLEVHEGYPPCATPLSDLKPLPSLLDLIVESHHVGRVLIVRTFCDPVRVEAFINAVEDQDGNVDRLAVYNVSAAAHPDRILPRATIFAIKEPYYRRANDGGVLIRVDHPSNIMLLSPNDVLVPAKWREEDETFTAEERNDHANFAASENQWHDADLLYTDAVKALDEVDEKDEKKKDEKDEKQDETKKDDNKVGVVDENDDGVNLRRTTILNRAHARLHLHHYELAHEDALKGVFTKPAAELSKEARDFNFKAYFRAGRASYELGNFAEAKRCFDLAVSCAADADAKAFVAEDLRRVAARLVEQQTGVYDFEAMAASATATHRHLDHASFLSNTKVGPAGHRGRGLFATRDIRHSEVVMVEKALFTVAPPASEPPPDEKTNPAAWRHTVEDHFHTERVYGLWKKIRGNPGQAAAFLDLYDGGKYFDGKKLLHTDVDGQVVVDMFQLRAILDHNVAVCPNVKSSQPDDKPKPSSTASSSSSSAAAAAVRSEGLWLRASYTNHSCIPNAHRAYMGDMMIVRATRHIKAGEEVLVHYVDPTRPYDVRKKRLAATHGFACDCPLCAAEATLGPEVLARRAKVAREVERFLEEDARVETTMRRPACEHTQKRVDVLLFALHATYDEALYARLPRFECVGLDLWLCETSWTPRDVLSSSQLLLRDMGIKVTWKQGEHVSLNRLYGGGVFFERVLGGLLVSGAARRVMGCLCAKRAMMKCKLLAEEIHVTLFGEKLKVRPGQYSRPYGGVASGASGHVGGARR